MMKKWLINLSVTLMAALLLVACGGGDTSSSGDGTKYTCSMHPQVMQDGPGSCPLCGMDLTPVKKKAPTPADTSGSDTDPHAGHDMGATEAKAEHPAVHLESAKAAVLSAKTVVAEKRSLLKSVQLFGEIAPVADRETMYSWYYSGRIEEVLVDFNTTEVKAGQPLLKVYSEAAIADQEMLLKLQRERWLRTFYERENLTTQIDAVALRLKEAAMSAEDLEQLKENKTVQKYFTIRAPRAGSLIGMLPRAGMRFSSTDVLLNVAPLNEVWFVAEVFEKDMSYVKLGQRLRVESKARPDETAIGEVVYVDRMVDPKTRTVNVRVLVPNEDLAFLPNLSATGTLRVKLGEVDVAIPPSAVIETGKREVVYVEAGPGHYEQRVVELGARTDDWVQIKSGIAAGDKVVTEGAFLIDAEAQLMGTSGGHNH